MTDEVSADLAPQEGSVASAAEAIERLMQGNRGEPQQEQPQAEAPAPSIEQAPEAENAASDDNEDRSGQEAPKPQEEAEPTAAVEGAVAEPAKPQEQTQQPRQAPQPDQAILQAQAARDNRINELSVLVPQAKALLQVHFPDIKSDEDLLNLIRQGTPEATARYNEYVLLKSRVGQFEQEHAQLMRTQFQDWQSSEVTKLVDLIPELKDPKQSPKVQKDIRDYAKTMGYTNQELAFASARDFAVLNAAMKGANAIKQAEKMIAENNKKTEAAIKAAQEKAAKAPPVQQPGASRQVTNKDEQVNEDMKRFRKSGRVDDLAAVLASRN